MSTDRPVFSGGGLLPTPTAQLALQLSCVLCLCLLLDGALRPLHLPAVVAEKVAGILLGPSAFGVTAAGAAAFSPASLPALKAIANVGLVLYIFETGASLDLDVPAARRRAKLSLLISVAGVAAAALLGGMAAWGLHARLEEPKPSAGPFLLIACSALSLTALPVLSSILGELHLRSTRIGSIALHAAAFDDAIAVLVLVFDAAIVRGSNAVEATLSLVCLVSLGSAFVFVIRPLASLAFQTWTSRASVHNGTSGRAVIPHAALAVALAVNFLCAWTTELIGVHVAAGAFLLGLCVPREGGLAGTIVARLEHMTSALLMPVYFAFSGQRTNLALITQAGLWPLTLAAAAASVVGKLFGCSIVAYCAGNLTWRQAGAVGTLMSSKGLVELIILNVGVDLDVLPAPAFSALVLATLFTTLTSQLLLRVVYPPEQIRSDDDEAKAAVAAVAGDWTLRKVMLFADAGAETRPLLAIAAALRGSIHEHNSSEQVNSRSLVLVRSLPQPEAEHDFGLGVLEGAGAGVNPPFLRAEELIDAAALGEWDDQDSDGEKEGHGSPQLHRDGIARRRGHENTAVALAEALPSPSPNSATLQLPAADNVQSEDAKSVSDKAGVKSEAEETDGGNAGNRSDHLASAARRGASNAFLRDPLSMLAIATAKELGLAQRLEFVVSRSHQPLLDLGDIVFRASPGLILLPISRSKGSDVATQRRNSRRGSGTSTTELPDHTASTNVPSQRSASKRLSGRHTQSLWRLISGTDNSSGVHGSAPDAAAGTSGRWLAGWLPHVSPFLHRLRSAPKAPIVAFVATHHSRTMWAQSRPSRVLVVLQASSASAVRGVKSYSEAAALADFEADEATGTLSLAEHLAAALPPGSLHVLVLAMRPQKLPDTLDSGATTIGSGTSTVVRGTISSNIARAFAPRPRPAVSGRAAVEGDDGSVKTEVNTTVASQADFVGLDVGIVTTDSRQDIGDAGVSVSASVSIDGRGRRPRLPGMWLERSQDSRPSSAAAPTSEPVANLPVLPPTSSKSASQVSDAPAPPLSKTVAPVPLPASSTPGRAALLLLQTGGRTATDKWESKLRSKIARRVYGPNFSRLVSADGVAQAAPTSAQVSTTSQSVVAIVDLCAVPEGGSGGGAPAHAVHALVEHVSKSSSTPFDLVIASGDSSRAEERDLQPLGRLLSEAWDKLPKRAIVMATCAHE